MRTSTINWNSADQLPQIPAGEMKYFLVAREGKPCFGAYYLNARPLHFEDGCPDAEMPGGEVCKSCDAGDGHPCTGWHEETADADQNFYHELSPRVHAWAEPPIFKAA
jgi:hypothetical protein